LAGGSVESLRAFYFLLTRIYFLLVLIRIICFVMSRIYFFADTKSVPLTKPSKKQKVPPAYSRTGDGARSLTNRRDDEILEGLSRYQMAQTYRP
jgi:hypothetical protein